MDVLLYCVLYCTVTAAESFYIATSGGGDFLSPPTFLLLAGHRQLC